MDINLVEIVINGVNLVKMFVKNSQNFVILGQKRRLRSKLAKNYFSVRFMDIHLVTNAIDEVNFVYNVVKIRS